MPWSASAQDNSTDSNASDCGCVPEKYALACEQFRDLAISRGDTIQSLSSELKACNLVRVDAQALEREAHQREQEKTRQLNKELTRFPTRWQAFGLGLVAGGLAGCGATLVNHKTTSSSVSSWVACGLTVSTGLFITIRF